MRDLIHIPAFEPVRRRTAADHWAELRAGEIFAEYFRDDRELRRQVIDAFNANPEKGPRPAPWRSCCCVGEDTALGDLLAEKVRGRSYRVGTHFKLIAALASCEGFIEFIEDFLGKDIEPENWSLPIGRRRASAGSSLTASFRGRCCRRLPREILFPLK